jgi:hypothetical protein
MVTTTPLGVVTLLHEIPFALAITPTGCGMTRLLVLM